MNRHPADPGSSLPSAAQQPGAPVPGAHGGPTRRQLLAAALAAGTAGSARAAAPAASSPAAPAAGAAPWLPEGATRLRELSQALARAPRRRDFRSVPMILTRAEEWDAEALTAVVAYRGGPKQAFDSTDLDSSWLNLMRNSMNVQVHSFGHADFLCVSVTHGTAHLALYDDFAWDKYRIGDLTKGKFQTNTPARLPAGLKTDPRDVQAPDGIYGSAGSVIPVLQRRGAVFMACHNQVWEMAAGRIRAGVNPDRLSHEALAAELTNHLVEGVVLTPGAIGTLPELQAAGFAYAK